MQSASLELDEDGAIISYEEYHPYGTTSYQENNSDIKAVAKRYRYTGKERDEESGLYYHGARYYVPWLGRWTAVDPLEDKYAGMNSYNYCVNNPVNFVDPDGKEIDLSNLTGDQLIKYKDAIEILSKSKLFDFYYRQITESNEVYAIISSNEDEGGGYFNPINNEVGVREDFNLYIFAQELFHAYQKDSGLYEDLDVMPFSTIEAEGDIMAVYVMLEINSGFPVFEWMRDILNQAYKNIPTSEEIEGEKYQEMFQNAVEKRIQYYKGQDVDVPTYTSPNTGERPKAIQETIKGAE